jgi:hypothetical protein
MAKPDLRDLPDEAVREEEITGEAKGAPLEGPEPGAEVVEGDPRLKGGGPGGAHELKGADALGGSDADIGRGAD